MGAILETGSRRVPIPGELARPFSRCRGMSCRAKGEARRNGLHQPRPRRRRGGSSPPTTRSFRTVCSILENVSNLGKLPVVSFFMALPLKIEHGTGSPVPGGSLRSSLGARHQTFDQAALDEEGDRQHRQQIDARRPPSSRPTGSGTGDERRDPDRHGLRGRACA